MSRQTFGRRVNAWLAEPKGEQFKDNKWRFWFVALIGFSLLNAVLTAVVFSAGGNLQANMGAVLVGVGALLAWLGLGALHYSDAADPQLSRGVALLDSVTLLFVVAHFSFLLWVYGHLTTLQRAEVDYRTAAEKFNADARQVSNDNAKIADAITRVADAEERKAKIENDTVYQARKAAERGAKVRTSRGARSIADNLSTSPVELERPEKPADSSAAYLARWDAYIRLTNFGELALAISTLIFIRVRSSRTNTPKDDEFPQEIDAGVVDDRRNTPRLDAGPKRANGRQSPTVAFSGDRKEAVKKLREHLKAIAFYHPGMWFKADLVRGGVTIRLFEKQAGHEIMICHTAQSDKLLAAVDRPDFRARLLDELIYQGFPLEKGGTQ